MIYKIKWWVGQVEQKRQKSLKMRGVEPILRDWGDVVVIVREGCSLTAILKLIICDCESQFRWCMINKSDFEGFLKSNRKGQIFDLEYKYGCC